MSVDLSIAAEPTVSVITTAPVAAPSGGEMDALLLGRIGVSVVQISSREDFDLFRKMSSC